MRAYKKNDTIKASTVMRVRGTNTFYVYMLRNKKNNKFYIGQTKDPKRRFYEHIVSPDMRGRLKADPKFWEFKILEVVLTNNKWEESRREEAREAESKHIHRLKHRHPVSCVNKGDGSCAKKRRDIRKAT